jgi:urease accessory protein
VTDLSGTVPWRPRIVPGLSGAAHVVLVQSGACLIADDDVQIAVSLGAGAALELSEIGATIAHDVRGHAGAKLSLEIEIDSGSTLIWAAAPLVLSRGAVLRRRVRVGVRAGAAVLLRDTLVLGRADEPPGALDADLSATVDGTPLLRERLLIGGQGLPPGSPIGLAGRRVLDTAMLLGRRDPRPPERTLELAGPGALWRTLSDDAATADRAVSQVWGHWSALLNRR